MTVHHFTLILDGDVDGRADALRAAGCGDAAFGEIDGVPYADFERDAPSFADAVARASAAVSSVGLRVVTAFRIEPPEPQ